jgi:nitrate/nitrite transport system ATP-binding protein
MADRVIPLIPSAGDGATLGEAISVPLARPRSRSSVMHDPAFRQLKRDIVQRLLEARRASQRELYEVGA